MIVFTDNGSIQKDAIQDIIYKKFELNDHLVKKFDKNYHYIKIENYKNITKLAKQLLWNLKEIKDENNELVFEFYTHNSEFQSYSAITLDSDIYLLLNLVMFIFENKYTYIDDIGTEINANTMSKIIKHFEDKRNISMLSYNIGLIAYINPLNCYILDTDSQNNASIICINDFCSNGEHHLINYINGLYGGIQK